MGKCVEKEGEWWLFLRKKVGEIWGNWERKRGSV
jgi:hypothetical protein